MRPPGVLHVRAHIAPDQQLLLFDWSIDLLVCHGRHHLRPIRCQLLPPTQHTNLRDNVPEWHDPCNVGRLLLRCGSHGLHEQCSHRSGLGLCGRLQSHGLGGRSKLYEVPDWGGYLLFGNGRNDLYIGLLHGVRWDLRAASVLPSRNDGRDWCWQSVLLRGGSDRLHKHRRDRIGPRVRCRLLRAQLGNLYGLWSAHDVLHGELRARVRHGLHGSGGPAELRHGRAERDELHGRDSVLCAKRTRRRLIHPTVFCRLLRRELPDRLQLQEPHLGQQLCVH